jgi:hypothetical protein
MRGFVNVAGGIFMGLGLLFAVLDGIGAAQFDLQRRPGHYSLIPVAPLAMYVTGGVILVRVHASWSGFGLWLLVVLASFVIQGGLPAAARAWRDRQ